MSTHADAPTRAHPGPPPAHATARAAATVAMCLSVALVVGAVSAVNLAVPALSASALHPSAQGVLWVVDGYVAVFACLLVPAGAVADRVGRKGTLMTGLAVFAAGALLCAAAPATGWLVAGRVLGGMGAAAVLPNTLALLVAGRAGHGRRRAVALWASMTGLAAVLGNVGGGAALQYGGWRTLFLALVPLALAALVLTAVVAPSPARHPRPVSPAGAVLFTAGVLALLYGILSGPTRGWSSPTALGSPVLGLAALGLWARWEKQRAQPLLDPRLFALPRVRAGTVGMAVLFAGMFGLFLVNGQYMQYAKGYGPLEAGVRLLPMAAALLTGPRCSLVLHRRVGPRRTVCAGLLVMACGLGVVATVTSGSTYLLYAVGAVLTALGCGLATPQLSQAVMDALPPERAAVGSALQSLARELGSALGVAVTGSLLTAVFVARLPAQVASHGPAPTTPAAALAAAPGRAAGVVTAFTDAIGVALPCLAVLVAATALLVPRWLPAGD